MRKQLHIIMLPYSAFGHLIPFHLIAVALAKCGVKVTYVSTPKNISRLPKIPLALQELLIYVEFPLPPDVPLDGGEATVDVPLEKHEILKAAFDSLRDHFEDLVIKLSPDWVMYDMVGYWVAEVGRKHSIPSMFLSVFSGASAAFLGNPECCLPEGRERLRPSWDSLTSTPIWFDFPSTVAYTKHEAMMHYPMLYNDNGSGKKDAERLYKAFTYSTAFASRTCYEYEGDYLKALEKTLNKPVVPLGFVLPDLTQHSQRDTDWERTFDWLDKQQPSSVVFVSFGSELKMSREFIEELAHGLEQSGLPFLWSLRRPSWAKEDLDALPSGFLEKTMGKGVTMFGWSPQMDILAHPAIGGSMFHGGWGSIIETLQFGHVLVVLPSIFDQPLNARLLVERGIGVEVNKSEDGSFTRDDVSKALTHAMKSDAGKELRLKTKEMSEKLFGNRSLQDDYMKKFVEYLEINSNN